MCSGIHLRESRLQKQQSHKHGTDELVQRHVDLVSDLFRRMLVVVECIFCIHQLLFSFQVHVVRDYRTCLCDPVPLPSVEEFDHSQVLRLYVIDWIPRFSRLRNSLAAEENGSSFFCESAFYINFSRPESSTKF